MQRYLVLENGSVYTGQAFGATKPVTGEIVFNTGMSGYQESITDLSYHGQILTFTYPLIGNYGINAEDIESFKPAAKAIITHEVARRPSNWRATMSLPDWATKNDLPGLTGVDTRALTKEIRDYGVMRAALVDEVTPAIIEELKAVTPSHQAVLDVSTQRPYVNPTDGPSIALIDFGLKNSILRTLAKRNVNVTVFPATVSAETILAAGVDGVLLSNGPGDPTDVPSAVTMIQKVQAQLPVMGICLGHQLFALANGAQTFKMKFGHRGFNHAVRNLVTGRIDFTSQNHGYAVDPASLVGTQLEVTQEEINDHTVEGLRLKGRPAFSVQYHPDAAPGPHDAEYLFDDFLTLITDAKEKKGGSYA